MTGDQQDMLARLKSVLPTRWFADDTPVLDGLLAGFSATWSWVHGLFTAMRRQSRIATATDAFLDMIALDFFGTGLRRRAGQGDDAFRARISAELLRERATRAALVAAVADLTGRTPLVFEPLRPADTGAWNLAAGYGRAGGWGSLALPFQCFVTAYRAQGQGIAAVTGWGQPAGGYGSGAAEYASLSMLQGQVTDADINATIAGVMPAAAIAWTRISN